MANSIQSTLINETGGVESSSSQSLTNSWRPLLKISSHDDKQARISYECWLNRISPLMDF